MVVYSDELCHHGILGMKWGVRRYQNNDGTLTSAGKRRYHSTDIRSAIARRKNEKIDKSFKKWQDSAKKREAAIDLGKKMNLSMIESSKNPTDKSLKAQAKSDKKAYEKALRENTTYRKGQVRQEVRSDLSRKYLSEAKKVSKQLALDPGNRELQKKYNYYMSKHDMERASARRATEVAAKRSRKKASIKRAISMSTKAIATSAAIGAGVYAANRYLTEHDVQLNGKQVSLRDTQVKDIVELAKKAKNILGYI